MKKLNLLIVENDQDEQLFMREAVKAGDLFNLWEILRNGDTLFEWLSKNKKVPDLILSDLNMPGKNGYDIIEGLKSDPAYKDIPVVITSTAASPSTIQKCIASGAAAYLVKPETFISYDEFFKELHQLLVEKKIVN
jgi:CheY-like chemotaxis protein